MLVYLAFYFVKVIIIALLTLVVKKLLKNAIAQNLTAVAGLLVLFHFFHFTTLQCLSYVIAFEAFNFALNFTQKSKKDQLFFYGLCFFASTVIDFDILFLAMGTFKIAVFTLHESLIILMFLLHTLPKLLKLYGNLNQIDYIYKEQMEAASEHNKNKNAVFYIMLLAKIVGDVFFTDRSQLLRDREFQKLRTEVSEILSILKAKNGVSTEKVNEQKLSKKSQ